MNITLEQYILNPMGKNNAVLNATARESIRQNYVKKFGNVMLRENGKINYFLFKDEKRNTYWAYIKIPSETVRNFYYDVVLEFFTNQSGGGDNLFDYNVRFFSNDPAFVYTYAHVFLKNDLFIKELSNKMSKQAIRKAPNEKNPTGNVGYVKSLYFAYLFMRNMGLNKKIKFEGESKKLDLNYLISQIMDADEKIRLRQEKEPEKKERVGVKKVGIPIIQNSSNSLGVKKTKTTSIIGNKISNIKSVKKVSTIKRK